jgi:acyl carrier protein
MMNQPLETEVLLKELLIQFVPNFSEEQINLETRLVEDMMLGSIAIIQLVVEIEDKFSITIDDEDLNYNNFLKFSSLLSMVKRLIANGV